MTQFSELLKALSQGGVDFIVVGGVAAAAHGAARTTSDLDVVYQRSAENLARVVSVLAPFSPYPRGAAAGLPFKWDERTLRFGTNFTLTTSLGYLDLLGEITGGGSYEEILPHTLKITVFGTACLCINLDHLISVKRAAGRPKDFEAIAELEVIQQEKSQGDGNRT